MTEGAVPPRVLFVWDQFGPYHMDRCEAIGAALAGRFEVVGVEIASTSTTYAWAPTGSGQCFVKRTLFHGVAAEALGVAAVTKALVREVTREGTAAVFLTGYEKPSHFAAAIAARLRGIRTIVMLDSKYDDKPRKAWLEAAKRVLMLPYAGGFASGRRSADYLHSLGFGKRLVTQGYDSVSLSRIRDLAAEASVPNWSDRPFLAIARYVPKKNLDKLLRMYAAFRKVAPASPRGLVLCGGGPLETELRRLAETLGISDWVTFTGFVGQPEVARHLKSALCLLLPSVEEQWGLVVNEALAFDLPILLSPEVGATDTLVADDENGYLLEPKSRDDWVRAMLRIAADRSVWERLSAGSRERAPLGDVGLFVAGAIPHLPR